MAYKYNLTVDVFKGTSDKIPMRSVAVGPIEVPEPLQYGDRIQVQLSQIVLANLGEVYQRQVHPANKVRNLTTDIHTRVWDVSRARIDIITDLELTVKEFLTTQTRGRRASK